MSSFSFFPVHSSNLAILFPARTRAISKTAFRPCYSSLFSPPQHDARIKKLHQLKERCGQQETSISSKPKTSSVSLFRHSSHPIFGLSQFDARVTQIDVTAQAAYRPFKRSCFSAIEKLELGRCQELGFTLVSTAFSICFINLVFSCPSSFRLSTTRR